MIKILSSFNKVVIQEYLNYAGLFNKL